MITRTPSSDHRCEPVALAREKFLAAAKGRRFRLIRPEEDSPADDRLAICLSSDSLATLPEAKIAPRLARFARDPRPHLFLIPLTYSAELTSEGMNRHRTVQPAAWWEEQLRRFFPNLTPLAGPGDQWCGFLSREVDPTIVHDLKRGAHESRGAKALDRLKTGMLLAYRSLNGLLTTREEFLSRVENRTISLVGNARSLAQSRWGTAIDHNDLVIRFNRAPIVAVTSHGRRTDLLATSVAIEESLVRERGISLVLWMSPVRRKMGPQTLRIGPLFLFPRGDYAALCRKAGDRPSTGLMTIWLLQQSGCKRVEMYGFDFFASFSLSGGQTLETTPHHFGNEKEYVHRLLQTDHRFQLCR